MNKVPQEIIDNKDAELLKEWFRGIGSSAMNKKNFKQVHSFFSAVGYDNKPFKEDNIYYRVDSDSRVYKCKFKNLNNIFKFY